MATSESKIVVGVVLAAGLSHRMGQFKPLLPWGKRTVLQQVVGTLQGCDMVGSVVVVSGHRSQDLEPQLNGMGVQIAKNPDYERGMLLSIKVGINAARGADAVVLALVDQPGVEPITIHALIQEWKRTRAAVVIPTYAGKRGHPVVMAGSCIDEILALKDDQTLKTFMDRHRGEIAELGVDDSSVLDDLDTPEEYRNALERFNRRAPQ